MDIEPDRSATLTKLSGCSRGITWIHAELRATSQSFNRQTWFSSFALTGQRQTPKWLTCPEILKIYESHRTGGGLRHRVWRWLKLAWRRRRKLNGCKTGSRSPGAPQDHVEMTTAPGNSRNSSKWLSISEWALLPPLSAAATQRRLETLDISKHWRLDKTSRIHDVKSCLQQY